MFLNRKTKAWVAIIFFVLAVALVGSFDKSDNLYIPVLIIICLGVSYIYGTSVVKDLKRERAVDRTLRGLPPLPPEDDSDEDDEKSEDHDVEYSRKGDTHEVYGDWDHFDVNNHYIDFTRKDPYTGKVIHYKKY
jgi:hypothetical protein